MHNFLIYVIFLGYMKAEIYAEIEYLLWPVLQLNSVSFQ